MLLPSCARFSGAAKMVVVYAAIGDASGMMAHLLPLLLKQLATGFQLFSIGDQLLDGGHVDLMGFTTKTFT